MHLLSQEEFYLVITEQASIFPKGVKLWVLPLVTIFRSVVITFLSAKQAERNRASSDVNVSACNNGLPLSPASVLWCEQQLKQRSHHCKHTCRIYRHSYMGFATFFHWCFLIIILNTWTSTTSRNTRRHLSKSCVATTRRWWKQLWVLEHYSNTIMLLRWSALFQQETDICNNTLINTLNAQWARGSLYPSLHSWTTQRAPRGRSYLHIVCVWRGRFKPLIRL